MANQAEPAGHFDSLRTGGWDSARFLELFLNDGTLLRSSPFLKLFLPSRTPLGHNAGRGRQKENLQQ